MLGLQDRLTSIKTIGLSLILLMVISWGLVSCGDRLEPVQLLSTQALTETVRAGKLAEVAPPKIIEQLNQILDQYQPQVSILSPVADQVFPETKVQVKLQVEDLPIFQDSHRKMGPHLHLIVDNNPYKSIYDLNNPIILENLAPGTHTLRVFAVRPWHESFKNDEAYAQTTFHIITKTEDNLPSSQQPLLTYNLPQGNYGAEPIMVDFYLTNAPLHLVAQQNPEDDIKDWRIRVTINGESFLLDNWQTIYLKGFDSGENWVKLEFLDEQGNLVKNVFNNTVRVITYQPQGEDTLSQLMGGELSLEQAKGIVIANYQAPPVPEPIPTPVGTPTVEPESELELTTEREELSPAATQAAETPVEELTDTEGISEEIIVIPTSETEVVEEEILIPEETKTIEPVQEQATQPEFTPETFITPVLETPEAIETKTSKTSKSDKITEEETPLTNEPVASSKSQPQWLKTIWDFLPKI